MRLLLIILIIMLMCGGLPQIGLHEHVGGYPQYLGGSVGLLLIIVLILVPLGVL